MPIETEYDAKAGLRIHTVSGDFSFDELRETLETLYSHPGFDPDADSLWDLRRAKVDFSAKDVRVLAEFVATNWGGGGQSRAVIVASKDFEFGMARMYQAVLEDQTPNPVRVFREIDQAKRWLVEGD